MNTEKHINDLDAALDDACAARLAGALDAALGAPPSARAAAAIFAAARRRARRVRARRAIIRAALAAAPIAACLAILIGIPALRLSQAPANGAGAATGANAANAATAAHGAPAAHVATATSASPASWQGADTATAQMPTRTSARPQWQGADIAPLLAIVELATPELETADIAADNDYLAFAAEDDGYMTLAEAETLAAEASAQAEASSETAPAWSSPFERFSHSLVAMQDYPAFAIDRAHSSRAYYDR